MIIIDLYNCIYYKYDEINVNLVEIFLNKLILYSNFFDEKIQVIFDGFFFKSNFRSKYDKVELFFPFGDADTEIIKMIQSMPSKTYLLITADREIINEVVKKKACDLLKPDEFWKELIFVEREIKFNLNNKNLKKTTRLKKTTDYKDFELDELFDKYIK
jgi:predicted RNA-binding protein with PIN domain